MKEPYSQYGSFVVLIIKLLVEKDIEKVNIKLSLTLSSQCATKEVVKLLASNGNSKLHCAWKSLAYINDETYVNGRVNLPIATREWVAIPLDCRLSSATPIERVINGMSI